MGKSMNLTDFISSDLRNAWIVEPNIKVYVRKGHHLVEGTIHTFLDIANIEVDEEARNQGVFTNFMEKATQLDSNIYVENILNPYVTQTCKRLGFTIQKKEFDELAYRLL